MEGANHLGIGSGGDEYHHMGDDFDVPIDPDFERLMLEEDDRLGKLGSLHQPSFDPFNNGPDVGSVDSSTTVATGSEGSTTKTQERKRRKNEVSFDISSDDVLRFSALSRRDAASKLKVSESTLKRVCRKYGIHRWPPRGKNKLHEQMSDDIPVDQNRLPLHPLSDAETSNQQVVTPPPNSDLGSIPWTGSDQWDVLNEQNSFSSLPIDTDSESTRVCRKYGVHRWPPRDLKKEEVFPLALSNVEDIGHLDSPEDLEVDTTKDGPRDVRTEPTDHSCPSSSHLEDESIITFESLPQHFGRRRADVAKSLGDSICRQHGITRWPNLQISVLGPLQNEGQAMGPLDPSQPSMDAVNNGRSSICAERSNLDIACSEESSIIPQKRKRGKTGVKIEHQDGISQLTSDMPSNQVLDSVAHVKPRDTAIQDTKTVTIRAKYENGFTIKFKLPLWSGLEELHQQVGKRLNLKAEGYDIMYEDEDGEPILVACDEDLQLCINTSRSSGKNSIVVLLGPKKLL